MSCVAFDVVLANSSCQNRSAKRLDNPPHRGKLHNLWNCHRKRIRSTLRSVKRFRVSLKAQVLCVVQVFYRTSLSPRDLIGRSSTLFRHVVSIPQLIDTVAQGNLPNVLHAPAAHKELLNTSPPWAGLCAREVRLGRLSRV